MPLPACSRPRRLGPRVAVRRPASSTKRRPKRSIVDTRSPLALQPGMRRAAARARGGDILGDRIGDRPAAAAVGHHGGRLVGGAEDQPLLVEKFGPRAAVSRVSCPAAHRQRVGEARLGDRPAERLALGVIGVEQRRPPGPAAPRRASTQVLRRPARRYSCRSRRSAASRARRRRPGRCARRGTVGDMRRCFPGATPRTSTGRSGTPTAWRISSAAALRREVLRRVAVRPQAVHQEAPAVGGR